MRTIQLALNSADPDNPQLANRLVNHVLDALEPGASRDARRIEEIHDSTLFRIEHHTHVRLNLTIIVTYRKA